MESLTQIKTKAADLKLKLSFAREHREREEQLLEQAEEKLRAAEEAQQVAQAIAQKIQSEAHGKIASIVSRCLFAVFGDDAYEFEIRFERKRGKTEPEFVLLSKDGGELSPLGSVGGGVADVVSFALRLAALRLSRPARRQLLVLDEPFRYLSRDRRPAAAKLLERLAEELGVQLIIVSHDEEFQIGQVQELC